MNKERRLQNSEAPVVQGPFIQMLNSSKNMSESKVKRNTVI